VLRGAEQLDFMVISGVLYVGVSLYLFISYVSGPPLEPGGI
jgi:hypothetical protein